MSRVTRLCHVQGLYEYVKPRWEERAQPNVANFDVKSFGASAVAHRPTYADSGEPAADGAVKQPT